MYIFFMTMIGVIVWLSTGAFWAIPVLFVLSLIPSGLVLFTIVALAFWAMLA
jgi:hypothetical protein